MSNSKINVDDYYKAAENILLELGAIKQCKFHMDSDFFYGTGKYESSDILYGTATNIFKEKYPKLDDYDLFHKQISSIIDIGEIHSADDCPLCVKEANDWI